MAVLAPPASAADIVPRELTITVTHLGPEDRTCQIDADLYVPANVTAAHPGPALLATNGFARRVTVGQQSGPHFIPGAEALLRSH